MSDKKFVLIDEFNYIYVMVGLINLMVHVDRYESVFNKKVEEVDLQWLFKRIGKYKYRDRHSNVVICRDCVDALDVSLIKVN